MKQTKDYIRNNIIKLLQENLSIREVASRLNIPRSTIGDIRKNT
jgi:IS30 family transposase